MKMLNSLRAMKAMSYLLVVCRRQLLALSRQQLLKEGYRVSFLQISKSTRRIRVVVQESELLKEKSMMESERLKAARRLKALRRL
mmetsp:Transcript_12095/g.30524  ORF Transcript_12095/g.30524 Transcript_12095/m.30524 type:complete len:85 (+) Transcript_12095:1815-2069(+)